MLEPYIYLTDMKVVLILQSNSWQESGYLYFPKCQAAPFMQSVSILTVLGMVIFFFLQLVTNWLVKKQLVSLDVTEVPVSCLPSSKPGSNTSISCAMLTLLLHGSTPVILNPLFYALSHNRIHVQTAVG